MNVQQIVDRILDCSLDETDADNTLETRVLSDVQEVYNELQHSISDVATADYMQTDEFKNGIKNLIDYAENDSVAIMCAEAVPWRCHRSLVGDALLVRDITVEDIFSLTSTKPHKLTPWAQVQDDEIIYPDTDVDKG